MARISGANPGSKGLFTGLFITFIYWLTKRKLGKVVMPVQIVAHHPKLLSSYCVMEQMFAKSDLLEAPLKDLVQLRAATLIGCPF